MVLAISLASLIAFLMAAVRSRFSGAMTAWRSLIHLGRIASLRTGARAGQRQNGRLVSDSDIALDVEHLSSSSSSSSPSAPSSVQEISSYHEAVSSLVGDGLSDGTG